MTGGYLCCLSNQLMPGILNVGMTELTPEKRLNEANKPDTFIPTPYKLEFAKKVLNPKQKIITLHKLLSQYTERFKPEGEFFRVSIEEVNTLFDLIDGDLWVKDLKEEEKHVEHSEVEGDEASVIDVVKKTIDGKFYFIDNNNFVYDGINYFVDDRNVVFDAPKTTKMGIYDKKENKITYYQSTISNSPFVKCRDNRDMRKCFLNGQRIRHCIPRAACPVWVGVYDFDKNVIICDKKNYKSLNEFAEMHYVIANFDIVNFVDGWYECEFDLFHTNCWVSIYNSFVKNKNW